LTEYSDCCCLLVLCSDRIQTKQIGRKKDSHFKWKNVQLQELEFYDFHETIAVKNSERIVLQASYSWLFC